jgi:putative ABC transport system ATP-binding protein
MLSVQSLCKSLPVPAGQPPRRLLADISFAVAPGEMVALVGESGSGKTTLLNLLAGLERPDSGSIRLDDTEISELDDDASALLRRHRFGFVFQAFHILPHLTVSQNVALPLWLIRCAAAEAARRSQDALDSVGLADRANSWPRELSGGELQRIAVARALIHRPRLLLADEPTGNLDSENAERVLALLAESVRAAGAIGLLVTHSRSAAALANRALMLNRDGTIAPFQA